MKMKYLLLHLVFVCFLAGCKISIDIPTEEERLVAKMRDKADSIKFFKESESGLCFAYLWVGSMEGGPAMSEVPCEKVETTSKFVK